MTKYVTIATCCLAIALVRPCVNAQSKFTVNAAKMGQVADIFVGRVMLKYNYTEMACYNVLARVDLRCMFLMDDQWRI